MATHFTRVVDKLERWANIIGTSCIIIIAGAVCSDVAYRVIFRSSILGVLELVMLLLVCVALFTFSYTQKQGGHIRMLLVVTRLRGNWAWASEIVSLSLFLLFAVFATYAGIIRAIESVSILETMEGLTNFPVWPSKLLIPIGYFLLCVRICIQMLQKIIPSGEKPETVQTEPEF